MYFSHSVVPAYISSASTITVIRCFQYTPIFAIFSKDMFQIDEYYRGNNYIVYSILLKLTTNLPQMTCVDINQHSRIFISRHLKRTSEVSEVTGLTDTVSL